MSLPNDTKPASAAAAPLEPKVSNARLVLRSYVRANAMYPQTRFYFVIDVSGRLGTEGLAVQLSDGPPALPYSKLAEYANRTHAGRSVAKRVNEEAIRADITKMHSALANCHARYGPNTLAAFVGDCSSLAAALDASDLSVRYRDFISDGAPGAKDVCRKANPLVVDLLPYVEPYPRLMDALWPEITKSIWVVRDAV